MLGSGQLRRPNDYSPAVIPFFALVVVITAAFVALSFLLAGPRETADSSFDFPPFRMVREESTSSFFYAPLRTELECRGRNDWTERHIRSNGTVGLPTKEARGDQVLLYGMGEALTYPVGDESVHVPGVWFRDIIATIPGPRETRTESGSTVTVTRRTPTDTEKWDADAATGIPIGYRQIVDGVVVRESRVVSLVLADGTVIR